MRTELVPFCNMTVPTACETGGVSGARGLVMYRARAHEYRTNGLPLCTIKISASGPVIYPQWSKASRGRWACSCRQSSVVTKKILNIKDLFSSKINKSIFLGALEHACDLVFKTSKNITNHSGAAKWQHETCTHAYTNQDISDTKIPIIYKRSFRTPCRWCTFFPQLLSCQSYVD